MLNNELEKENQVLRRENEILKAKSNGVVSGAEDMVNLLSRRVAKSEKELLEKNALIASLRKQLESYQHGVSGSGAGSDTGNGSSHAAGAGANQMISAASNEKEGLFKMVTWAPSTKLVERIPAPEYSGSEDEEEDEDNKTSTSFTATYGAALGEVEDEEEEESDNDNDTSSNLVKRIQERPQRKDPLPTELEEAQVGNNNVIAMRQLGARNSSKKGSANRFNNRTNSLLFLTNNKGIPPGTGGPRAHTPPMERVSSPQPSNSSGNTSPVSNTSSPNADEMNVDFHLNGQSTSSRPPPTSANRPEVPQPTRTSSANSSAQSSPSLEPKQFTPLDRKPQSLAAQARTPRIQSAASSGSPIQRPATPPHIDERERENNSVSSLSSVMTMAQEVVDLGPSSMENLTTLANVIIFIPASTISLQKKGETFLFYIRLMSMGGEQLHEVSHLHTDFSLLDRKIRHSVPKEMVTQLPSLPDKSLFSGYSPAKGDIRKSSLEQYLNDVKRIVPENEHLIRFVSSSSVTEKADDTHGKGEMKGYLAKRGKSFGNWKSRYFVLDKNMLFYYDNEEGPYCGKIQLTNCTVHAQEYDPDNDFLHGFVIQDSKRSGAASHILCADNDAMRDKWIEAIRREIGQHSGCRAESGVDVDAGSDSDASVASFERGTGNNSSKQKEKTRFNWVKRREAANEAGCGEAKGLFGVELEVAVECFRYKDSEVPTVVARCIEFLEQQKAFEEEGIYRLSGSSKVVQTLRDRFDREGDVDLVAENNATRDSGDPFVFDVHVIAGLLKLYLRLLPSPLLTRQLQPHFSQATEISDRPMRVQATAKLFSHLPKPNMAVIHALASNLITVVRHHAKNKMTVRNVAIVFSPTLGISAGLLINLLQDFDAIYKGGVNAPYLTDSS
jgi:hypothetical protein